MKRLPNKRRLARLRQIMEFVYPVEPISYVRREFQTRRHKNPRYSIRAFARDLGLSPSHLSEFLAGKTNLSSDKAVSLAERLRLDGRHKEHWCDLILIHSKLRPEREAARIRIRRRIEGDTSSLSDATFKTISEWQHFAILAYFGACQSLTVQDLSQRMGLTVAKIKQAVDRLVRLNLLQKTDMGYRATDDHSFAGNTVPSEAIRESHKQVLRKAIQALDQFNMQERESQSLFISVPEARFASFKEAVRLKVLELAAEYSASDIKESDVRVQAMTLQIFPVDQKEGSDND